MDKYATKKTVAQGLLDIGLLMANASQLKAVIDVGPVQDYYYANIVLLSISIFLQTVIGAILIVLGSKKYKSQTQANKTVSILNDVSVGLAFGITVVNIFISAFGIKLSNG